MSFPTNPDSFLSEFLLSKIKKLRSEDPLCSNAALFNGVFKQLNEIFPEIYRKKYVQTIFSDLIKKEEKRQERRVHVVGPVRIRSGSSSINLVLSDNNRVSATTLQTGERPGKTSAAVEPISTSAVCEDEFEQEVEEAEEFRRQREEICTTVENPKPIGSGVLTTPCKPILQQNKKHHLVADVLPVTRTSRSIVPKIHAEYLQSHETNFIPDVLSCALEKIVQTGIEDFHAEIGKLPNTRDGHFVRSILSDFYHLIYFSNNHALAHTNSERKFMIESVSPLLRFLENTYTFIIFDWVENNSRATKKINQMADPSTPSKTYAVDILGRVKKEEVVYVELSGGEDEATTHAIEDSTKIANEMINGLRIRLSHFLDLGIDMVPKMSTFGLQQIGCRLTLVEVNCINKNLFRMTELKSATLPRSFAEIDIYIDVFDLLFCLITKCQQQVEVPSQFRRALRNTGKPTTVCREWISHLPSESGKICYT